MGGAKGGRGRSAAKGGTGGKDRGAQDRDSSAGPAKGGKGKGKDAGKGKGKGKAKAAGKGDGEATKEASKLAKNPPAASKDTADDDVEDGESSDVTKALVEALRAFSQPKWWLIGKKENGQSPGDGAIRKRMRPEEFSQKCAERHAQMRKVYESTMLQDSEQRWLRKVCSEGTSGDKVASLTMLIQVCPVFATGYIKSLLTMAGKTARSDSMMALDALKELFISTLLPDRKLKTMAQMDPISPKGLSKVAFTELSVVAFFEDFLKTVFAGFIHVLSEAAHSSVTFFKSKAIRTAYDLLSAKPEQERALLSMLVNKFGDSAAKVSSNVSFHLKNLVEAHPGMKSIVVKEIEAFLMRPNITQKSEYCAVLHLSEMQLSQKKDAEVASQLVRLFVSRLQASLRGDRFKASIIASRQKAKKEAEANGKRLRWWRPQPKKGRRRGLLADEDNRLVRTLINGIQRAMPYLDTTADSTAVNEETMNALFKVCHTVSAFSTRIAILSLLFRCLFERTRGEPPDRFYRLIYEQIAQFDLFTSAHKHQAVLLLQRCVPADMSVGRAVAMCRRLLQVGANAQAPVAVAALAVLRELLVARRAEVRPLLQSVDAELKASADVDDDDGEERFVDDDAPGAAPAGDAKEAERTTYTPMARDPRHAKSRQTPLWELYALRSHVHPFVAYGAAQLLQAGSFEDVGSNPFETFSQSEMLEEFVLSSRANRESKKDRKKDSKDKQSKKRIAFTTERFSKKKNVLPHERFFQLYFKDATVQRLQRLKEKNKHEKEDDFDEEGGKSGEEGSEPDEEEEDKFFDEYLQGQIPGADDDGEDGDDPDMDDDSDFGDPSDDDEEGGDDDDDADFDDDPLRNEGDQPSEDSEDGEEEEEATPRKGRKRKAPETAAPKSKDDRIKSLRKLHAKSSFASVEDFEGLLDDDGADA